MTTGETLKKQLGLEKLPQVRLNRALVSSRPTYYVWCDSLHPNGNITNERIGRFPETMAIYARGNFRKKVVFSPLIDIEEYNGTLTSYIFVVIDLAGQMFTNPIYRESIEQPQISLMLYGKLNEFIKLSDLRTQGMSDFTLNFRKQRNKVQGTENRLAKLLDFTVDEKEGWVMFSWLTDATTNAYDLDHPFMNTDPDNDFALVKNPSKLYTMQIKILDFFTHLSNLKADEDKIITRAEIKQILELANVQVWSDSPAYHWQGMNWAISQLDGSIHPTDIEPKRWNAPELHGDGQAFVSKDLGGLLAQMGFFLNQMAAMCTSRLKKRGLL